MVTTRKSAPRTTPQARTKLPPIEFSTKDKKFTLTYTLEGSRKVYHAVVLAADPEAAIERLKRHTPAQNITVNEVK